MSRLRLMGEGDAGVAAHTHAEADITDGALLARLAANEAISGAWDFSAGKLRLSQGPDASKPATGNSEGQVYWATDTDKLYVWDGAAWKEIGAAAAAGSSALVNLAQNGGFEETALPTANTPSGWALEGAPTSVAPSTDVAADAAGARSILIDAAAINQGLKQTLKNLKASTQYYVFARAKATAGATARLFTTGAATNLDVTTTSTTWTTLSGTFTTDASGTDVVLKLVESVLGTGVYFDDVLVVEGAAAAPFAPNPLDSLLKAIDHQNGTGTTNNDYARLRLETGRLNVTGGGTPAVDTTITFSQAFSKFLCGWAIAETLTPIGAMIDSPSTAGMTVRLRHMDGTNWSITVKMNWCAIGVD